ncbi:hypothetical protein MN116_007430 [Schistosoma mekongi]|uniref:Uncharacterized protein n=1 Tax=Schistosoma mekongi TaxID=38744 RepID=A0AAE2D3A8_SCHME|nr:hypothetical protein MN116_007430 [Schistosoma mekongi]
MGWRFSATCSASTVLYSTESIVYNSYLVENDQIEKQHEQEQQQQLSSSATSTSSPSSKDTIQLEEITVNHNELNEYEVNQNQTVIVKKNDQCQINIITSTELSKIVENEYEDDIKLKETLNKEDNLKKLITSEIIDKSEEQSEIIERHSFKKEKPVVEQKTEEDSNGDSSSDKQVDSNLSNEVKVKEDTANEQNGIHEEMHKVTELVQSINENTTADISQTTTPTIPAQL